MLFNLTGIPDPVLFFVNDNQENQEVFIIGTQVVSPFHHKTFGTIRGQLKTDCNILKPFTENILSINLADPTCLGFLEDKNMITLLQNLNLTAVVILDNTPSVRWRVSSPYKRMETFRNHWRQSDSTTLPVILLVRSIDWGQFSEHLRSGKKLGVSQDKNIQLEQMDMFSCFFQKEIKVRVDQGKTMTSGISGHNEITIMRNGTIVKEVQISVTCSFNGEDCNRDVRPFKIVTKCHNIKDVIPTFYISSKNTSFQPDYLIMETGEFEMTCCKDSETFMRILSYEPKNLLEKYTRLKQSSVQCRFSNVIEESCVSGLIHSSKYCVTQDVIQDDYIIHEYKELSCKSKQPKKCNKRFICW